MGGLLAFRAPSGDLYGTYRRLPDLPGQDGGIRVHSAEHVWTEAEIEEGVGVSRLNVFQLDRYVRVEEVAEKAVRVIDGDAAACPVGGMLAFRYSTGNLGTYWTRVADDPEEPGRMMLREVGRDDGALFCAEPADLHFYVRIELVEEVVS